MTSPDAGAPNAVAVQSALADLGRISLAGHSLESVVRTVTELTARVLPDPPIASVTILRGAQPTTVAASMVSTATMVLPAPTSPCNKRCMRNGAAMSVEISATARDCAPVS